MLLKFNWSTPSVVRQALAAREGMPDAAQAHAGRPTAASHLLRGALVGAAIGLIAAFHGQLAPRLVVSPEWVFTGAAQGLDEWVYMALCRAVWRSPTFLTYEYPFLLGWSAPPVMIQLPIAALAWIGKLIGLPLAFEVARIAGASASGAAMAAIGWKLFGTPQWRLWFYLAAVCGGGMFWIGAVRQSIRVAGLVGLTDFVPYLRYAMGTFYEWRPYLLQNVTYPLEPVYHALVLSALACVLYRRWIAVWVLGMCLWYSNPFPAVALAAPLLGYFVVRTIIAGRRRNANVIKLLMWLGITTAGLAYYLLFLPQWPAFRDLVIGHHGPTLQVLSSPGWLMLLMPWAAIIVICAWNRRVWRVMRRDAALALFAWVAVCHLLLLAQGFLIGKRAVQPFHFDRGYLQIALVALAFGLTYRRLHIPRVVPAWLKAVVLISLTDQSLFFAEYLSRGIVIGCVQKDLARIAQRMDEIPGRLVYHFTSPSTNIYFASVTHHQPFHAPETMVIPFAEERQHMLDAALGGHRKLRDVGLSLFITPVDGPYLPLVRSQGWNTIYTTPKYLLLAAPDIPYDL